jgi:hypothetical protein
MYYLSGGAHRSRGKEAGSAIDWSSLRRIERDGGLFAALSAGHSHLNSLLDSGNLGRGNRRQSIILGLFAGFAALGFVLQTLVVKEHLLANRPDEWLTAIDACDRSILKVRRLLSVDFLRPAV